MKCNWCDGTYEDCGCGVGHCDHCKNGEVTNPPFGPLSYVRDCPSLDILSSEDMENILNNKLNIYEQFSSVPKYLGYPDSLSSDELSIFNKYWDNVYRDETLGDVLNRIAWLVKEKQKNN